MKKLVVFLMVLGLVIGGSGLAQADSWQTTPVLGYDSNYDGNVNVITTTGTIVIPYSDFPDGPLSNGTSMTSFYVGQAVHTGSGVFLDEGEYSWTASITGLGSNLGRTIGYFSGTDGGNDFTMLYGSALNGDLTVPHGDFLTLADVGSWRYTETWARAGTAGLTAYADFTVGVPEPATMLLLGLGLVGLAGIRRKFKS